jgi:two-component system NtrC family sensor kinase
MTFGWQSSRNIAVAGASLLALGGVGLGVAPRMLPWGPVLGLGLASGLTALALLARERAAEARSRNRLENDLTEAQAEASRLGTVLDASTDGFLLEDARGRVVGSNAAFARMWGLAGTLAPGMDAIEIRERLMAQVKDPGGALARGLVTTFEVLDLWDGRVFERHHRPHPEPGGLEGRIWTFRDITARARADQFVHRLSQAVEQSPVSILITDTAGTMEFVNARFTQVTGFELLEALGRNPRIMKSERTPPRMYEELWSTISSGEVWVGELQNRKKNGELFWERATIAPLRSPDGVITHYLGLKEDITVQKHLEAQLRHSQKLEAVGLLAGGVAHDLNNILQVINGYGTLMQMVQAPEDPNRNGLSEILKAADRAAQLTHSLLAFSRKQVMNPRTLDLNGIVANVEKLLRRIVPADVKLEVLRGAEPLQVHGDLGQIEQVLLNLVNNARDAMPHGGSLGISTALFQWDEAFRNQCGFGKVGDYALLRVQDSGEAMDPGTLKRIFEPFFSTQELGRGTGLGLATIYGIVKQHEGYIIVESSAETGSAFSVYLPIATSALSVREEPALRENQIKGTETILVAEDEPSVRGLLEIILKKYGYGVLLAADGQEAVERFRAHREEVGMVLMDIIMPHKSGRQAYEEMRQERPGLKVLFISGYTADFIKDRGDLDHEMELLMKPVQPLVLLRKLREILDRRPSPPDVA